MSGPSTTPDDRAKFSRRLRIGFVLLVALSGALVATQAGGDPVIVVAGAVGGALLGVALSWYVWRVGAGALEGGRREDRRR